jgi:large subunit ribosomal protein L9
MEVILKEDLKNLGKAGDIVKVSEGYARNFLFPAKKAVPSTEGAVKNVQAQVKKKEDRQKASDSLAAGAAEKLAGVEIIIKKKASTDGKLFGSVSESDVAAELAKLGHKVDKTGIRMDKHIKEPGTYEVIVHFKGAAEAKIKLRVEKQNAAKTV